MQNSNMPKARNFIRYLLMAVAFAIVTVPVWAGTLNATTVNKSGEAMSDVVIYAMPVGGAVAASGHAEGATIAQDHLQFTPYVTVVRTGTEIKFPNYDKVEHHVKSFSAVKEFEIKPYEKTTPPPILFDKPGIVIIYCLIHEWMRAYVMVVDTPYFGKSDASGAVTFNDLPPGNYEIRAWHPDMGSIKPPLLQTLRVDAQGSQQVKFAFDFIPKKRKAVSAG
ncbi:MAG TPA: carboxypeptidase regulatory-like domain-containing protein [Burkholderiaceae bacterium]|jgi:plastocyanin|nr:carboxypeptidase regulatory-like domain-containing protein [Burkholderiaceae bacterium]